MAEVLSELKSESFSLKYPNVEIVSSCIFVPRGYNIYKSLHFIFLNFFASCLHT